MLYAFSCECGHEQDEFIPMAERNTACVECSACGKQMRRVVTLPNAAGPSTFIPPWMQDNNISGNARHREWLKTKKAKDMDLVKQARGDED